MGTLGFFALVFLAVSQPLDAGNHFQCAEQKRSAAAKSAGGPYPHTSGAVKALVVFAQFADEAHLGDQLPAYAAELFAADRPGSLTHYYAAMSFGQLHLSGHIMPRRYTAPRAASAYLAAPGQELGGYGEFVEEILAQVDQEVDLARFDNNGADGRPNSGDDDGLVDYVFVLVRSAPTDFISGRATGRAGLNLSTFRSQRAKSPKGKAIAIRGMRYYGAIAEEGNFAQTVGVLAHEFGHSMGLPDLYDGEYQGPEEDSAGIGKWGLMGWGAHGWNGDDGPMPMCPWSREQLGWISGAERLLDFQAGTATALVGLEQGGAIYRIDLGRGEEYLLLEGRSRADYYNRKLPAEGALLWHIRPQNGASNDREEAKLVELVSADGLDNLDRWAHDEEYRRRFGGNKGDATDMFDGVKFRSVERYSTHIELGRRDGIVYASMVGPTRSLQAVPGPQGQRQPNINAPAQPALVAAPTERRAIEQQQASTLGRNGTAAVQEQQRNSVAAAPNVTAVESLGDTPQANSLGQNYPNPANPATTIAFALAQPAQVQLTIYNTLGQLVRILLDGHRGVGSHRAIWDGRDQQGRPAASGIYLYRLEAAGLFAATRQLALVR